MNQFLIQDGVHLPCVCWPTLRRLDGKAEAWPSSIRLATTMTTTAVDVVVVVAVVVETQLPTPLKAADRLLLSVASRQSCC